MLTHRETWPPWSQPAWLTEAAAWLAAQLPRLDRRQTGPITQPHVRLWSTVLRVPTDAGDLYLKACAPNLAHEPTLVQALAAWYPDCILAPLAVDTTRGWLLLPEGGPSLRRLIQQDRDLTRWERALRRYAELQLDASRRPAALLAAGVLDRRLAGLTDRYTALLADEAALGAGTAEGISADQLARLRDYTPQVAALGRALAAYGLPETLQHDDFHDGNIFVQAGRYYFFDWGEACLAQPFFTLVVALRSLAHTLGLDPAGPAGDAARAAYLSAWTGLASLADLQEAYRLADRLGRLNRALTWQHVLAGLPEALRAPHAEAVPGWLLDFWEAEQAARPVDQ